MTEYQKQIQLLRNSISGMPNIPLKQECFKIADALDASVPVRFGA